VTFTIPTAIPELQRARSHFRGNNGTQEFAFPMQTFNLLSQLDIEYLCEILCWRRTGFSHYYVNSTSTTSKSSHAHLFAAT